MYEYFSPDNYPPSFPLGVSHFMRLIKLLEASSMETIPVAVEFVFLTSSQLLVLGRIWAPLHYTYLRVNFRQRSPLQAFFISYAQRIWISIFVLSSLAMLGYLSASAFFASRSAAQSSQIVHLITSGLDVDSNQVSEACKAHDMYVLQWPRAAIIGRYIVHSPPGKCIY
jgi:hypothetical protein